MSEYCINCEAGAKRIAELEAALNLAALDHRGIKNVLGKPDSKLGVMTLIDGEHYARLQAEAERDSWMEQRDAEQEAWADELRSRVQAEAALAERDAVLRLLKAEMPRLYGLLCARAKEGSET